MATKFKFLNQEQADRLHKVLSEVGFTGRLQVTAYDSQGDMFQAVVEPPKPDPESFEARKSKALHAITNREATPPYASYGNNQGSLYIYHKTDDGRWVTSHVNYYEVIEAVARRILKSVTP